MTDNLIMVNRIKQRMTEIGINAKQLAEKADVGKSFVYDILNGKSKNPTSNKLSSISKHLGIPLSYIMNIEEDAIDTTKYITVQSLSEEEQMQCPSVLLLSSLFNRIANYNTFYSFTIRDDSMETTFYNNDLIIIDTFKKKHDPVGFFLIKDEFSTTVRRIEHIMGSQKLRVIADNNKYATYEQDMDKVQLIGKVIWYLRAV